ncbi:MAG: RluA family pseudouridine synthase, partial [Mangrovicoccus sp.]
PAPGAMRGTLVHALLHHCGDSLSGIGGEKRPGIVHRIDKETSGILVVAKTDRAHHGLAAQFEAHSAEREYRAFAFGVPDVGDPRLAGLQGVGFEPSGILKLTTELGRHRTDRQRQAVMFSGGRRAVTRARVVQSFGTPPAISELRCWLETGRTHQIRVHLAYAGHGLLGDPVYGGRRKLPKTVPEPVRKVIDGFGRQALHAAVLGLIHPVSGEKLRFEADLPADMAALATALQGLA